VSTESHHGESIPFFSFSHLDHRSTTSIPIASRFFYAHLILTFLLPFTCYFVFCCCIGQKNKAK
jgi:hypothetical protein